MGFARIVVVLLALFVLGVMLSGCPGLSKDPEIAAKQQWIAGCKIADSQIQTATKLYKAGQISESAATKIDDAVTLYELVCTGEPPEPGVPIASTALMALAAKVCPTMAPTNPDDWILTAIDAAACAAEGALLAEAT
jgi:hypothetical protein